MSIANTPQPRSDIVEGVYPHHAASYSYPCLVPELSLPKFPQPANERAEAAACTTSLLLCSLSSRANSAKKPCAALVDASEGKEGKKQKKTQPPKRHAGLRCQMLFEMRRFQLAVGPRAWAAIGQPIARQPGGQRASARAAVASGSSLFLHSHLDNKRPPGISTRRANEPPSEAQGGGQAQAQPLASLSRFQPHVVIRRRLWPVWTASDGADGWLRGIRRCICVARAAVRCQLRLLMAALRPFFQSVVLLPLVIPIPPRPLVLLQRQSSMLVALVLALAGSSGLQIHAGGAAKDGTTPSD
ncbi:hypothetical protein MKX08_008945 [Trichoderma sp. CBMAI-0020]|nr:hypothetical protein MKX08_008945 [Trichoderma sp. CBMAI-0020]